MIRGAWLLVLVAGSGCGGSESGEAQAPPTPPPPPKNVTLSDPPGKIIEGYGMLPLPERGGQTYAPRYSPDELREAVRRRFAKISGEDDLRAATQTLYRFREFRQYAEVVRKPSDGRYLLMPEAVFKPYDASLATAEKDVRAAVVARLKGHAAAGPDFLSDLRVLGEFQDAALVRAALDEYLRLDRAKAEELVFSTSFTFLRWPPERGVLSLPADVVVPMAARLDRSRAAKGLDAWLETTRTTRNLSIQASPELVTVLRELLDVDASRERWMRRASHPLVFSVGPGFLKDHVLAKKPRLSDVERAEILVALAACGDTGSVEFGVLESLLGKTFESGGEALAEPVAKLFASVAKENNRLRYLLDRFLPPALKKPSAPQYADLLRAVRGSASSEGLRLFRYFLGQVFGQPDAPHAAMVRACVEMFGPDEAENREWFHVVRQRIPPAAMGDLGKALERDGLPLETVLQGLAELARGGKPAAMLPLVDKTLQSGGKNVGRFLERLRDLLQPAEAVPIVNGFLASFKAEGEVDERTREYRRKVIELAAPADAGPRLAGLLGKASEKATKADLCRTILVLNDKRVVKALVEFRVREGESFAYLDRGLAQMVGVSLQTGETLPQWFERVKAKLPPQVPPRE